MNSATSFLEVADGWHELFICLYVHLFNKPIGHCLCGFSKCSKETGFLAIPCDCLPFPWIEQFGCKFSLDFA